MDNSLDAHDQIRQLASRYAVYLDARDIESLVQLYVPDVRVSKDLSGRDALAGLLDSALRGVGLTFLNVGSHLIELDGVGDTATGIAYTRAEIQDGGPESSRWITHLIQYHDTYRCIDGQWYFAANRKHYLVAGYEQAASPLGLEPANWPKNQTGMGSVPFELDTWKQFWAQE